MRILVLLGVLGGVPPLLALPQESVPVPQAPRLAPEASPSPRPPTVPWSEGRVIPVRIPLSGPGREFMTTLAFPEDSIETAITGWGDGDLTAIPKRGLLFLRLARKSEGQLNVIGGSGTHYLFHLKGVEAGEPDSYDSYLKIEKPAAAPKADALPKPEPRRPGEAVELLQAMRLGLRTEGTRILRAHRELAFESPSLEVRLLYVYDAPSYRGLVFEVRNPTAQRQSVDASRFRGEGTALVLTALRENVLEPKAVTRLYALTWKD